MVDLMPLDEYQRKRDFTKSPEPSGDRDAARRRARKKPSLYFCVQKHLASHLHYDLRLEHDGVLLSWAVPNGPSFDPREKRLAVHVEDHPLDYGDFEGTIPAGAYGAGTVMLWDEGTWQPEGDAEAGLAKGDLKFVLDGERLKGRWVLVRMKGSRTGKYAKENRRSKNENWLLIKESDRYAGPEKKPVTERALTSVRSGRTMEEIAAGNVEWADSGPRFKEKKDARPSKAKHGRQPRAAPPKFVPPQLATLADAPPAGDQWLHEIKFDGYRIVAAVGGGKAVTYTRTGLDWSDRFRPLLRPLADLPCTSAVIDGEAVVVDADGWSDFGALQQALSEGGAGIVYYAFDLMTLDGKDIGKLPLAERKARLRTLLADEPDSGPLFYSDHVVGHGAETFERACALHLEGIVSKRADGRYRSGRTKSWLKVKCGMGQEFIIIGWQPSPVKARPFSSILVATRDEDRLVYRGRVGSGFDETTLADLADKFKARAVKAPPAADVPAAVEKNARFIKPDMVAEIAFRGWTGEGYVRQGAFKGLRSDKAADAVVKELARPVPKDPPALVSVDSDQDAGTIEIAGVRVTHPDRVMFPGERITKRALIDYYLAVADKILPHVADRPLSLVRFPDGTGGDGFFQKHASAGFPDAFKPVTIKEKEGKGKYFYIEDERGLVAAVQMGALELHVWGAHVGALEQPDRLVFDFDPDEAVAFPTVTASAKAMRERLSALGLTSFALATGGKGLHVVVPLTPRHGWDDVKAFAEAMARTLAAEDPDRYIAEASKTRRKGRIFIDYLRNGRGATAIAPFSTRARAGAPVAWPVAWNGLGRLKSAHETTATNAAALLKLQRKDPWENYFAVEQVLPLDRLTSK